MGELVNEFLDSQYSASPAPTNSADISIARFGSYVRSGATSSNAIGGANWVNDLTNDALNPPYSFSGVISEVIVFDRKLTETERQSVYSYLARKYRLDSALPDSFTDSHYGAYAVGATYWQVEHHPNNKGLSTIPAGTDFGGITLEDFFSLPEQIYKSKGSPLANGTTLGSDTYTVIGE